MHPSNIPSFPFAVLDHTGFWGAFSLDPSLLSWETDSEAEICIQGGYGGGQSEQDRGEKEKLN